MAATGPSLTQEVADACQGEKVIAVNDAYRLFPNAEILYACDGKWWNVHKGAPGFGGQKWSSHGDDNHDNKLEPAQKWGLNLVHGRQLYGFSKNSRHIHYGDNSGFQAINLAMLFGASVIVLVGFNMQVVRGERHFFGDHPEGLSNATNFVKWLPCFEGGAATVPDGVEIINATPNSALTCFKMMGLADALSYRPSSECRQHVAASG